MTTVRDHSVTIALLADSNPSPACPACLSPPANGDGVLQYEEFVVWWAEKTGEDGRCRARADRAPALAHQSSRGEREELLELLGSLQLPAGACEQDADAARAYLEH